MVIDMVKDLEILVALIFLFIGVFFIFNARGVVRKKIKDKDKDENKVVYIVKVVAYFVILLALIAIYFLIRR